MDRKERLETNCTNHKELSLPIDKYRKTDKPVQWNCVTCVDAHEATRGQWSCSCLQRLSHDFWPSNPDTSCSTRSPFARQVVMGLHSSISLYCQEPQCRIWRITSIVPPLQPPWPQIHSELANNIIAVPLQRPTLLFQHQSMQIIITHK